MLRFISTLLFVMFFLQSYSHLCNLNAHPAVKLFISTLRKYVYETSQSSKSWLRLQSSVWELDVNFSTYFREVI